MGSDLDETTRRTIDSFLRKRLTEDGLPGLSLTVVDGGGSVYEQGYGSRELASNDPATPETVYGVGSVSKSFASLATLLLVERDDLSLDDSVTDHLDVDVPDDVTLHHLLSHTSGYPSLAVSEALIARQMDVGEAGVPLGTRGDFYGHLEGARDEVATEPGERWAYCNSGYTLTGDVIEAVTGTAYTDFVTEEILDPLGMDRSTYDESVFDSFEDRMTPYTSDDGEFEETPLPIRERSAAAGGLLAPVTDLGRYLRCHLGGGTVEGERLIDESVLEAAYGAHAETPSGPYGYGWRTREVAGSTLIGHGGSIAVSTAYVGFAPEHDVGVALLANGSPGYGLAELGTAVFAAIAGGDPNARPFFARKRRLESLAGEYETYRGIKQGEVTVEGGTIKLRVGGPIDEGSWTPLVPDDLEAGEFHAITMSGNEQPVEFVEEDDSVSLYVDRWRLHKQ